MYGTLAFTYYLAYSNKKHIFFAMTVVPTCWGVLFECLQMFVPNRSASLDDAVANAIGAFLVTVVTMLGSRIKH